MTSDGVRPAGRPIRIDEVRRADHIGLFGAVVEVLNVRDHADFPAALQVMLRRVPDGQPLSTLVDRDQMVVGWYLPRRVRLRCALCLWPISRDIDMALGIPTLGRCLACSHPLSEQAGMLPTVRPRAVSPADGAGQPAAR